MGRHLLPRKRNPQPILETPDNGEYKLLSELLVEWREQLVNEGDAPVYWEGLVLGGHQRQSVPDLLRQTRFGKPHYIITHGSKWTQNYG